MYWRSFRQIVGACRSVLACGQHVATIHHNKIQKKLEVPRMGLPGYPQSSSISEIVPNKKPSSYGGPPMTNGSIESEWLQVAEPERAKACALLCGSFGPRPVEAKAWGPVAPGVALGKWRALRVSNPWGLPQNGWCNYGKIHGLTWRDSGVCIFWGGSMHHPSFHGAFY